MQIKSSSMLRYSSMDHRQGRRLRTFSPVNILNGHDTGQAGIIYNISADGMFVLSENKVEVNDIVNLDLLSPSDDESPVTIPGIVIHTNKHGFGMIYRRLDYLAEATMAQMFSNAFASS